MAASTTTSSTWEESEILEEKNEGRVSGGGERRHARIRVPEQNHETEANIFPESETNAEADIEQAIGTITEKGEVVKPDPSAAFPDGGLEAVS